MASASRVDPAVSALPCRPCPTRSCTDWAGAGWGWSTWPSTASGRPVALKRLALHGSAEEMAGPPAHPPRGRRPWPRSTTPTSSRCSTWSTRTTTSCWSCPTCRGGTLGECVTGSGPLPPDRRALPGRRPARRAGRGPPGRHRAPRHQAGQRAVRRRRPPLPDRLRRGHHARRHLGADRDRDGHRHARVHGARAGPGRAGHRRPATCSPWGPRCASPPPASPPTAGATPGWCCTGPPRARSSASPAELPRDLRRRLEPLLDRRPDRRPTAAAARGRGRRHPGAARPTRAARPGHGLSAVAGPAGRRWRWPRVAVGATAVGPGPGPIRCSADRRPPPRPRRRPPPPRPPPPAPRRTTSRAAAPAARSPTAWPASRTTPTTTASRSTAVRPHPTRVDGATFDQHHPANLVPGHRRRPLPVPPRAATSNSCATASAKVTLTAPAGVAMRLEVLDRRQGRSGPGREPRRPRRPRCRSRPDDCYGDKGADLVAQVAGWARPAAAGRLRAGPHRLLLTGDGRDSAVRRPGRVAAMTDRAGPTSTWA